MSRPLALGAAVFAASIAAFAVLDLAFASLWYMLDLQIYRWAGLVVRHAGDLYGSRFQHYNLRFTYPPMAALVFAAFSAMPLPALKWAITACGIASLAGTSWLTWGMLGYRRSAVRAGAALAAAGAALWLQPVLQTLQLGQVNLILMFIILADCSLPGNARLKGAGIGLAAGFKLTPLIFIPYLILSRRWRAAMVAVATFAATVAVSLIVLPGQSRQFWFGGLFLDSGRTGNNAYAGNQSLNGTLARLLGGQAAAHPYWLAVSAVVGAAGLLIAACWSRRGHELTGILTCALTGLLISPISWTHHWVWAAPALIAALGVARRGMARRGMARRGTARRAAASWRWVRWPALLVPVVVFFIPPPQSLVPAALAQGTGAHGIALLTGNLYVIDGIVLLVLSGFALFWHRRSPRTGVRNQA